MPGEELAPFPTPESDTPPPRQRRWLRWVLILSAPLLLTITLIGLGVDQALVQWMLVHEDPMRPADVMLLDNPWSVGTAIRLVKEGTVQTILVDKAPPQHYTNDGPPVGLQFFTTKELIHRDAPMDSVAYLPRAATSMLDRHTMLRDWMIDNDADSLLIYTGRLSSGYTKSVLRDSLETAGITVIIRPVGDPKNIWRKNVLGLQNMLIRWAYWKWNYSHHFTPRSID